MELSNSTDLSKEFKEVEEFKIQNLSPDKKKTFAIK